MPGPGRTAKAMPRRSPSPRLSRTLSDQSGDRFGKNPPSIHNTEDELFYFVDGSGILTLGGTLVGAKRTNANNQRRSEIQGGTEIRVSKGDIYIVPQNTPHMLTPAGGLLIDLSLHLAGSLR